MKVEQNQRELGILENKLPKRALRTKSNKSELPMFDLELQSECANFRLARKARGNVLTQLGESTAREKQYSITCRRGAPNC
jgi:hypothetical protein